MGEAARRPLYETKDDLARERAIARVLEDRWRCEALKLPMAYALDFALVREGRLVQAVAEIKVRRYSWEKLHEMGGITLSAAKWQAAKALCGLGEIPFLLVVEADGDLRYARVVDFSHDGVVWAGRKDRGDWQDREPCVLIGVDRFRPLGAGQGAASPPPSGG